MDRRRRRGVRGRAPDSEAALQERVIGLARFYGWRHYHTHDSRRSAAGFPDLVLLRPPELVIVELKTAKGPIRPEQREWLEELTAVADALDEAIGPRRALVNADGVAPAFDVYLVRPEHLDALHDRLARGRVRQEWVGAT